MPDMIEAGMKYIILVTKHHEGFCLWDSKYTTYDVASSGNTTNVIEAVAKECKKQGKFRDKNIQLLKELKKRIKDL